MVQAVATGVRKQHSKLSSHLQNFKLIDLSLVAGKDIWRITNAKTEEYFSDIFKNLNARKIYSRIMLLISRLVNGEEKHNELFETLTNSIKIISEFLKRDDFLEKSEIIETVMVIRILNLLGYINKNNNNKEFVENTSEITEDICNAVKINMKSHILEINRALRESQL